MIREKAMTEDLDLPPPADKTDVLWFLPPHGDGRYLGNVQGARHVSLGYLSQIARAADELGYFGVLLPTGRSCEDSWGIASAMVRQLAELVPGQHIGLQTDEAEPFYAALGFRHQPSFMSLVVGTWLDNAADPPGAT